jgi:hypothetical protein
VARSTSLARVIVVPGLAVRVRGTSGASPAGQRLRRQACCRRPPGAASIMILSVMVAT